MKKASKFWLAILTVFTLMICASPAEAKTERYDRLDGVDAVSYTHLDVYKRQILDLSLLLWP